MCGPTIYRGSPDLVDKPINIYAINCGARRFVTFATIMPLLNIYRTVNNIRTSQYRLLVLSVQLADVRYSFATPGYR
jgi:hypothetical protein